MVHNYQNQLDATENAKIGKVKQLKTDACEFKEKATAVVATANAFKTAAGNEGDGFLKKANVFGSDNGGGQANQFQDAAAAYGEGAECAGSTESAAAKLKLFAQALVAATLQFKKFGESLATASDVSCELLKKHAEGFASEVAEFKNAAEKFAQAANGGSGFLNKAKKFREEADKIPDITVNVHAGPVYTALEKFKSAADKFVLAGIKFEEFATEVPTNSGDCNMITILAQPFGEAADRFQQNAKAFKEQANSFAHKANTFSRAVGHMEFKQLAGAFKGAATQLKLLAEGLALNLTSTNLKTQATEFKDAAIAFQGAADAFNTAASKVGTGVQNDADLKQIKEQFKEAATAFQKAAEQFGSEAGKVIKAFNAFKEVLSEAKGSCQKLTSAAQDFTRAANQFQQQAGQFKGLVDQIEDITIKVQVTEGGGKGTGKTVTLIKQSKVQLAMAAFKRASVAFGGTGEAADKFYALAAALQKLSTTITCQQLKALSGKFTNAAKTFQGNAQLFKEQAGEFKTWAEEFSKGGTSPKFRAAAAYYAVAATYFQKLATELAKALKTDTELQPKAHELLQKAIAFYTEASEFHDLASKVGTGKGSADLEQDEEDLKLIQEFNQAAFQNAATKFSQAAEQFYKDNGEGTVTKTFEDFKSALEEASGSCGALEGPAQQLKEAASTFKTNAEQFKSKVDGIEDIDLKTTVLKPSKVQSAISQFKLSAAKFHNAGEIFKTAADTFGKDGNQSAATKLGEFANALTSADCDTIKNNANAFKAKAAAFYIQATNFECAVTSFANEAQKFHDLALLVNKDDTKDQADLKTIQQALKNAADKFGKVDGGAASRLRIFIGHCPCR